METTQEQLTSEAMEAIEKDRPIPVSKEEFELINELTQIFVTSKF